MSKELNKKIEEFFNETPADSYRRGYDWKGYQVYEMEFNKPTYIGLPLVLLVKGNEIRWSTDDESLEYLDYSLAKSSK